MPRDFSIFNGEVEDMTFPMKLRNILMFITGLMAVNVFATTSASTAIRNVTVIDAINGSRENQTVIFTDDEIKLIQDTTLADVTDVTNVIDGKGKYLIPGLWDFHVHLTYEEDLTASMPGLFLSWGITSVRDTGGLLRNLLPVVATMRAETAIAPRVFFSGPLLDGNDVVYNGDGIPEIGVRNATPETARATIRELKDAGASFIKIYEMVSPKVFYAMVEAAREYNLPIDSHVPLSMRASVAGPLTDSIEHMRNIELDCTINSVTMHEARLLALKNPDHIAGAKLRASLHEAQRISAIDQYDEATCDQTLAALINNLQVPTLRLNALSLVIPFQRADWDDAFSRLPLSTRTRWQTAIQDFDPTADRIKFGEWSMFLAKRMHEKGLSLAAGTDTPIGLSVPGYSLHSELEMLVQAGLTPIEAIESATLNPAKYFGLESRMGSIDLGKVADLVLLEANPLTDIANTKRISLVVSKGRVIPASPDYTD